MKTSGYLYILLAVVAGLILSNLIAVPIKDKLTTKIIVKDNEELKMVIDTLSVESFEINKEVDNITISYIQADNTKKDGLKIMVFLLSTLVVVALILAVIRYVLHKINP